MSVRARVLFATMAVVWGIPYLLIKVGVDGGIGPSFLAWVRVAMGSAILLALAHRNGSLGTLRPVAPWIVLCGITEVAVPFPLIAFGETRVSSSLTAILIACVPLFVALLAIRFAPDERVHGRRLIGLVVGLGGVVALVGIDVAGSSRELLGAAAVLVSALGYAIGPLIISRKLAHLDSRAVFGAVLGSATIALLPFGALDLPSRTPTASAIGAVLALGLVCTALAFVVFFALIAEIGPSRASVITYVNPVIALAAGIVILGEHPGAGALIGLPAIIIGSFLATAGRKPADEPELADAAAGLDVEQPVVAPV